MDWSPCIQTIDRQQLPEECFAGTCCGGALGPDAPHSDLFISQEHALWVDGLLIKAIDLINGFSITLQSAAELSLIAYLHVKLAEHDVILAEGAPSETLRVHSGNVERFDNFAEYLRLYGEDAADEDRCAPIAFESGRERFLSRARCLHGSIVATRSTKLAIGSRNSSSPRLLSSQRGIYRARGAGRSGMERR